MAAAIAHQNHRLAIEALKVRFADEPWLVALIVIGSVARGTAFPTSDLDLVFLVTDTERARRERTGELSIDASDLGAWPKAHISGKVVDRNFLDAAAARGPEPARYAFTNARLLWSHDPAVGDVLRRIPIYQEHERVEKMRSFVSQLPVHLSYLQLGVLSKNAWLAAQTSTELVFFGGRLILAENRVLFANRKQFINQLSEAPEKPEDLVPNMQALMRNPTIEGARKIYDMVMGFRDWPQPPEGPWDRFGRDRESHWLAGWVPIADS
jgi:hypothetical protein